MNLPQHLSIVMDGNGRWAKKRFLPRVAGHRSGVEATRQIIKLCSQKKIPVLSLFAFSSENWNRPPQEVNFLMDLFLTALQRETAVLQEARIALRFIGDRTRFSDLLCEKIASVEKTTQNNTGMKLLIAADYGGQWDICQATKNLALQVQQGKLTPEKITPELISSMLSFADLPNPDLLIRTSGEQRISNFMLWQLAYTELYFTNTLWPDFNEIELEKALEAYANRERRFGKSSEQLSEMACSSKE